MVVEGVSRVIDLGGGKRVMQEFVRVFPLSSYCNDFGVDLLPIFFLGPDIEDLIPAALWADRYARGVGGVAETQSVCG